MLLLLVESFIFLEMKSYKLLELKISESGSKNSGELFISSEKSYSHFFSLVFRPIYSYYGRNG